jgi:hypothetical protein
MVVQCPHCEYEGVVSSVEAHISGKSDEAHKGHVGQSFRNSLPQVGEGDESAGVEDSESAGLSPGSALLMASALLVVVVLVGSSSGVSESAVEQSEDPEGWA